MNTIEGGSNPEIQPHIPAAKIKLQNRWTQDIHVSPGLDSEAGLMPDLLKIRMGNQKMVSEFNKNIMDKTAPWAAAFKPNMAFYEGEGIRGLVELERTMRYMRDSHPSVLRLLDAKRADIGNTNRGYAKMAFDEFGADAMTIAPFMGGSLISEGERKLVSLSPFLEQKDKLLFVLCRTSNEDAGELQDLPIPIRKLPNRYKEKFGDLDELADLVEYSTLEQELRDIAGYEEGTLPLYLVHAYKMAHDWNLNGNVGAVVGATYPQELKWIRQVIGDMPILLPGLGFQGGDAENAIKNGLDSTGHGLIVNSSRGIIFAGRGKENYDTTYAQEAAQAAESLHNDINTYRQAA